MILPVMQLPASAHGTESSCGADPPLWRAFTIREEMPKRDAEHRATHVCTVVGKEPLRTAGHRSETATVDETTLTLQAFGGLSIPPSHRSDAPLAKPVHVVVQWYSRQ
jgi:hypothetical protein